MVKGRRLDDNDNILLRWKGGARGILWASQVAVGRENGLMLRVYGSKAGLEWRQEDPNYLWYTAYGGRTELITRSGHGSGPAAARVTRVPAGLPEGYLEGFAALYTEIARALHLSEGTVRNHLSAAIGKTGATTRAEAVRTAVDNGWL
jgi:predicted dehydrogenase